MILKIKINSWQDQLVDLDPPAILKKMILIANDLEKS